MTTKTAFTALNAIFIPRRTLANSVCKASKHRRHQPVTSSIAEAANQSTSATSSPTNARRRLRKGDVVDLKIAKLAYGGGAVGFIQADDHVATEDVGMPVYAPKGACPGDVIRCMIKRVRRRKTPPDGAQISVRKSQSTVEIAAGSSRTYAEALFVEPLSISEHVIPTPCAHFGNFRLGGGGCGGCTTMHLSYQMQLAQKQEQVVALFGKITDMFDVRVGDIIPCAETWNFRNKMEFSWGRRWFENPMKREQLPVQSRLEHEYALGLHAPQRFDKIVTISECHIQDHVGNAIVQYVRQRSSELLLEPFDTVNNTGYLRNLVIRTATNSRGEQEVMVNFVTSLCEVPQRLVPLAEEIRQLFPSVVCVLQNMCMDKTSVVVQQDKERLLTGSRRYIEHYMCGLKFRISANSFFQTNSQQAQVLYDRVAEAAQLTPDDVVLDLFCGTGTIGLSLAEKCAQVYGVDIVEAAIEDARMNASVNHIENAAFVQGNLDKLTDPDAAQLGNPDVIVVDPPRAGLHPSLVKYLRDCDVKRIVYVSCNPASQVRDILHLMELAPDKFRVSAIEPVDMFPHTHHVECIATLERI